jgi:hypothetical protein
MSQTLSDEQLLFSLSAELPSLRQSLRLAETIATYPDGKSSRNPVINFAFGRAGPAVIENLILRMSEAVEPYIERASVKALSESLFVGASRQRRPKSDVLALLLRLRVEMVAHRVKLGGKDAQAYTELTEAYGGIWRFLEVVLDEIEALLERLQAADFFHFERLDSVSTRVYPEFTADDIRRVVSAANGVTSS